MRISISALLLLVAFTSFAQADENCDPCKTCTAGRGSGKQYCPNDPWTMGRLWLRQTGHFGRFYNCDCEENKRYSPYICWKNSGSTFTGGRLLQSIRCDVDRMKQRICDGASDCIGKRCRKKPNKSCHCPPNQSCDQCAK